MIGYEEIEARRENIETRIALLRQRYSEEERYGSELLLKNLLDQFPEPEEVEAA